MRCVWCWQNITKLYDHSFILGNLWLLCLQVKPTNKFSNCSILCQDIYHTISVESSGLNSRIWPASKLGCHIIHCYDKMYNSDMYCCGSAPTLYTWAAKKHIVIAVNYLHVIKHYNAISYHMTALPQLPSQTSGMILCHSNISAHHGQYGW